MAMINANPPQAHITCEFESVDLADLGIGRLRKETGGIRSVTVRRRKPRGRQETPYFPVLPLSSQNSSFSSTYLMAPPPQVSQGIFSAINEPEQSIEPEQIQSVTVEIRCGRKNARDIASRLTSLGATHIHIR